MTTLRYEINEKIANCVFIIIEIKSGRRNDSIIMWYENLIKAYEKQLETLELLNQ